MALVLRPALTADAALLWEWRNDESTRLNSFDEAPIEWNSHVAWLERKLASSECRIWILEDDRRPVGQIRFDRQDNVAAVDYAIDPQHRRRGLGTAILTLSLARACRELGVSDITGLVKLSNVASCRAFEKAGFVRVGEALNAGSVCLQFKRPCRLSRAGDLA